MERAFQVEGTACVKVKGEADENVWTEQPRGGDSVLRHPWVLLVDICAPPAFG